jgi:hypothetical protein
VDKFEAMQMFVRIVENGASRLSRKNVELMSAAG